METGSRVSARIWRGETRGRRASVLMEEKSVIYGHTVTLLRVICLW